MFAYRLVIMFVMTVTVSSVAIVQQRRALIVIARHDLEMM